MDIIPWEKVIIGTVIDDPKSWVEVADVQPKDLQSKQHQIVWTKALDLAMKDSLSLRSLAESLRVSGELESLGSANASGEAFLEELTTKADLTALTEARTQVLNASVKRELERLGVLLAQHARNGMTPDEILEEHMRDLLSIKIQGHRDPMPIWANAQAERERIRKIRSGEIDPPLEPNLTALKKLIPGFMPVDFVIIAATPGSGKSSLLRYEAHEWAKRGKRVLVFSYENTMEEWQSWIAARIANVNHDKVIFPKLMTNAEHERVDKAYEELEKLPIFIEEMFGDPLPMIIAATRKHMMKGNLDVILIDGAYLIGGKTESQYEKITSNTQGLRSFAQEVKVPVIATTQFNRSVNETKDPSQEQLLYGGEQPARTIIGLVHRSLEKYEAAEFPDNYVDGKLQLGKNMNTVVIQCSVLKQTNGRTGRSSDVAWVKPINDFRTLSDNWSEEAKRKLLKASKPAHIAAEQQNVVRSYPKPVRAEKPKGLGYPKTKQLGEVHEDHRAG